MVFQQAGAAHLATRLANNVAQLMSEQRLPAHGNQVELAGRKGDVAALRQRVRTRIRDRLALIQLDAGQVRAESALHFGLDRRGQVNRPSGMLDRRQVAHPAQGGLLRRVGGRGAAARHGASGRLGFLLIGLHKRHPFLGRWGLMRRYSRRVAWHGAGTVETCRTAYHAIVIIA